MQTIILNPGRARLALGLIAGCVAVWAIVVGAEPGLRPWALLVGALLISGVAGWLELVRRLSRRSLEAPTAGVERPAARRRWEEAALAALSFTVLVGLVGCLALAGVRLRRAEAPVSPLRSEVFHALPGCPASAARLRVMPAHCNDARYRIRYAASAFGLPYPKGGLNWLRVGPDAAFVRFCDEDVCRLGRIRRAVFPTRAVVR